MYSGQSDSTGSFAFALGENGKLKKEKIYTIRKAPAPPKNLQGVYYDTSNNQRVYSVQSDADGTYGYALKDSGDLDRSKKIYSIVVHNETTSADALEKGTVSKQTQDMLVASTNGWTSARQLKNSLDQSIGGGQGLVNTIFSWVDTNVNFAQSSVAGVEVTDEMRKQAGILSDVSDEDAKKTLQSKFEASRVQAMTRDLGDMFDFMDNREEEIQKLVIMGARDAKRTSFIMYVAKALRGAGKLNVADIETIKNIANAAKGSAQYVGAMGELEVEMYRRSRTATLQSLDKQHPGMVNSLRALDYYQTKDSSAGKFVAILGGSLGAYVIDPSTGSASMLTPVDFNYLKTTSDLIPPPKTVLR